MFSFEEELRFEWDQDEIEQVFYNFNLIFFDKKHTNAEVRFKLLGNSDEQRILLIIFTIRDQKVRVISCRDANKKERRQYENYQKTENHS